MSNQHYEKWLFKTFFGILLIGGGVFFMYFSLTQLDWKNYWVYFGLTSAISISIGAILLSTAAINKVKSDLIRKQKIKQMSN